MKMTLDQLSKHVHMLRTLKGEELKEYKHTMRVQRKQQTKIAKRVKKSATFVKYLKKARDHFNSITPITNRFICIDIENYERNQKLTTEIGMSIFTRHQEPVTRHFIISEYIDLYNGRFVEDNKMNFNFGTSEIVSLKDATNIVKNELSLGDTLLGHGMSEDIKVLNRLGIDIPTKLDTQVLFKLLLNENKTVSLGNVLKHFDINGRNLHNAGNDSHYTSYAFAHLANKISSETQ